MRIENIEQYNGSIETVHIVLSRSNLQALLVKLEQPDSFRTIMKFKNGTTLMVTAEPDEESYKNMIRGKMSPETEQRMKQLGVK
jgi:hypothetical protein